MRATVKVPYCGVKDPCEPDKRNSGLLQREGREDHERGGGRTRASSKGSGLTCLNEQELLCARYWEVGDSHEQYRKGVLQDFLGAQPSATSLQRSLLHLAECHSISDSSTRSRIGRRSFMSGG
jgi:hypothetical protein